MLIPLRYDTFIPLRYNSPGPLLLRPVDDWGSDFDGEVDGGFRAFNIWRYGRVYQHPVESRKKVAIKDYVARFRKPVADWRFVRVIGANLDSVYYEG